MSDSLNLFARAICYHGQEGGGALKARFSEWLAPAQQEQEAELTAEEITAKILKDLGGHNERL